MNQVVLPHKPNRTTKCSMTVKESSAEQICNALLALLPSPSASSDSTNSSSSRDDRTIEVMMPSLGSRRLGPHTPRQATKTDAGSTSRSRRWGGAAVQRVAPGNGGRGTRAPYTNPSRGIGETGVEDHMQEKGNLAERGSPPPSGHRSAGAATALTTARQSLAARGPIAPPPRATCP